MHKVLLSGSLAATLLLTLSLAGCTTLENRRDIYFPQCVWGPYTKMLHKGVPKPKPETVVLPKVTGSGKDVIKPQG